MLSQQASWQKPKQLLQQPIAEPGRISTRNTRHRGRLWPQNARLLMLTGAASPRCFILPFRSCCLGPHAPASVAITALGLQEVEAEPARVEASGRQRKPGHESWPAAFHIGCMRKPGMDMQGWGSSGRSRAGKAQARCRKLQAHETTRLDLLQIPFLFMCKPDLAMQGQGAAG